MGFQPKVLKQENIEKYNKVMVLQEANPTYSLTKCCRIAGLNQTMYYHYRNALRDLKK
jgi:hypothetical protein